VIEISSLTDLVHSDNGQAPIRQWVRRSLGFVGGDVILMTVLINLFSLGLPLLTLQVYDRIIPNAAYATFHYLLGGLLVVMGLDFGLKMLRASVTGYLGAKFEHKVGTTAFSRLLSGRLEATEAVPAGTHLDCIAGIEAIRDFYSGPAALAFVDMPFVLLFIALISLIGGWLAVVPLVVLAVALVTSVYMGNGLRAAVDGRRTWDDRRYNFIIETLGGIHTIKGLAMEQLMLRRYERLLTSAGESGHAVFLLAGVSQAVASFFGPLALASMAAAGALQVIDGSLTIGGLAACILLSGRVVTPVLKLLSGWTRYQTVSVAEQKVAELGSLPQDPFHAGSREPVEALELMSASFSYSDGAPKVMHDCNLRVSRGEMIGIRGTNGSGKSTLLSMLSGRLTPTEGQFLINDQYADGFDPHHLRQSIAYLSPRPVLMQGSVLENITFFAPRANLDRTLGYASRLGLDRTFAQMPQGYDTEVGEASASALPRGVAQRIAIVRALTRQPRFLLLDEVNSALDSEGEALFKDLLSDIRHSVGIVFVTYRPSLLRMCNRVYGLSAGQLVPNSDFDDIIDGQRQ